MSEAWFRQALRVGLTWGICSLGLLARANAEEILEFPEVFFSSQTFAPLLGPGGCVIQAGQSHPGQLKWLACEPDPKVEICRSIDSRVKENARAIQARLEDYTREVAQARTQAVLSVSRKMGAAPPVSRTAEHGDFSRRFWKLAELEFSEQRRAADARMVQTLEKSRPQVEARVKQARDSLIEAIQLSKGLGADGAILTNFLKCDLDIGVELKEGGFSDNAFMGAERDTDGGLAAYQYAMEVGDEVTLSHETSKKPGHGGIVRINPLSATKGKCSLSLTPRLWLACSQSESMCMQLVMHEFGHVLNSCHVHQLGIDAETKSREVANPTESIRLDFLSKQARKVAATLFERTSCLGGLVAPGGLNVALPNQCAAKPLPKPGTIQERCQTENAPGYPGQWGEAEADFWGASGMARWLEKTHGTYHERARAMYETWALYCQNETEMTESFRRVVAGSAADRAEASKFEKTILLKSEAEQLENKKEGCEAIPAQVTRAKPWGDVHQAWDLRINRNFLRNTEVRRVLGCEQTRQWVPLTCGP